MKKSIAAAGVLALLASTGAKAADIVTYQEQPVAAAPTAINWNGLYAGGTIGGSWANAKTRLKNGKTKIAKKEIDPDSFIGGIYAGYNFQPGFLSSSVLKDVVFGVETDFLFNSGDSSGKKSIKDYSAANAYKANIREKWNGATRLRAGYALGSEGRFLPYIAAGVSYADIQSRARLSTDGGKNYGPRVSKTKTRAGWNIGAGVDYVPPIMNDHLVLRAEYRYTDFGKETYNRGAFAAAADLKQRVKFNQNDFRVGVAYKF